MKNKRLIIVGFVALGFLAIGGAFANFVPTVEIAWVLSLLMTVFFFPLKSYR